MNKPDKGTFIAEDDKYIQEWLTKISWLHFGEIGSVKDDAVMQELPPLPTAPTVLKN